MTGGASEMIERLYVHNFRCLENFEFAARELPTALLFGENGSGKSTIRRALTNLQQIGRGTSRVGNLFAPGDFCRGRTDLPIRLELHARLAGHAYHYSLALEFPNNFKELRVYQESFSVDGQAVYSRSQAQVTVHGSSETKEAKFMVDWHLIALAVLQFRSESDDLSKFKRWLAHMIILAPLPPLMTGDTTDSTLEPGIEGADFGNWFAGVLGRKPAAYAQIDRFLKDLMPDFRELEQVQVGVNITRMNISFRKDQANLTIPFGALSDGEKCFFLGALVLAANRVYGPLFCFWDEPDNFLSISEVGRFVAELRSAFGDSGQLLVTSHNPEAILRFSDENTFVLHRKSHLEPTLLTRLDDLKLQGSLAEALITGDVIP